MFGGATSAVIMLPLALAYGVASGLGASAGLYGAIALGLLAALTGGTPNMVSGPTAAVAVTTSVVIAHHADNLGDVFTITILAGLIQIALGSLRVGNYVSYTPYSVISGIVTGLGIIIMVLETRPFLGLPAFTTGTLDTLRAWPEAVGNINLEAFWVAATTLAVAIAWPRRLHVLVPSAMVALIVGTTLSVLWLKDAPLIGDVPQGLPRLQTPNLSLELLVGAVQPAATIALVGSLDTVLTTLVARSMTRRQYSADRDLLGLGIGTVATGLVGGLAGGGTLCTIANIRAGARSRVSSVLCALILLGLLLGLGEYAESIPHAVLAGILMKIGWDLIDWRFISRIHRVQREHLVIMVVTLALAVFVDLIAAVALGLIVAALASARQIERLELDSVVSTPLIDDSFLGPGHGAADATDPFRARVGLVALRGSFTVASSQKLMDSIAADIEHHEIVILDFSGTLHLDDSAALVVEYMVEIAVAQGTHAVVLSLAGQPRASLQGLGALRLVPRHHFVESLDEARDLAKRLLAPKA